MLIAEEINESDKRQKIVELCNDLKTYIDSLWKNLMTEEMTLYEQCEVCFF